MAKIATDKVTQHKGDNYWSFLQSYYVMYTGIKNNYFKVVKDQRLNIVLNLVKQDRNIEDLVKKYYRKEPQELFDLISEFKSLKHFLKWLQSEIRLSKFLSSRDTRLSIREGMEDLDDLYSSTVF